MADIDDLIARLAQDAAAVKPAPHPFVLSIKLTGMAALYLLVSLAVSGLRPDWADKLHSPMYVAEIVALLAIFASTTLASALLVFPDLHQKARLALAPLFAFALFGLILLLAWHGDNPPAPLPVHSFECTLSIAAVSLLPLFWTLVLMRRAASTHCRLAGGVALLSSFSVGALWLRLHEVNDSILHVIAWHYLPMLLVGIIGLWLGKRILKW